MWVFLFYRIFIDNNNNKVFLCEKINTKNYENL